MLLTEMKIYELSYQKVGYVLTIKNILFLLTVHLSGVLPSLAGNPAGWARQAYALSMYVVTFTLISNLATDYIQKRRGEPFEYNLSPKLISK